MDKTTAALRQTETMQGESDFSTRGKKPSQSHPDIAQSFFYLFFQRSKKGAAVPAKGQHTSLRRNGNKKKTTKITHKTPQPPPLLPHGNGRLKALPPIQS